MERIGHVSHMIPLPTSLGLGNGAVWGLDSLTKTKFHIPLDKWVVLRIMQGVR